MFAIRLKVVQFRAASSDFLLLWVNVEHIFMLFYDDFFLNAQATKKTSHVHEAAGINDIYFV